MAAVLACDQEGRPAFLSHRSAAELWGLLDQTRGLVDVSVGGDGGRKRRAGIRIHRSTTLEPSMTTRRDGIPVTNAARTIADLRRSKPDRGGANAAQLRRAVREAEVLGLPTGPDVESDHTRSDLERLFLRICREGGIPPPQVNVEVGGVLVDFLWPESGSIVETDSYLYHRGRIAFVNDHARDLKLTELGFKVARFSDDQLNREPKRVAAAVRALLLRAT